MCARWAKDVWLGRCVRSYSLAIPVFSYPSMCISISIFFSLRLCRWRLSFIYFFCFLYYFIDIGWMFVFFFSSFLMTRQTFRTELIWIFGLYRSVHSYDFLSLSSCRRYRFTWKFDNSACAKSIQLSYNYTNVLKFNGHNRERFVRVLSTWWRIYALFFAYSLYLFKWYPPHITPMCLCLTIHKNQHSQKQIHWVISLLQSWYIYIYMCMYVIHSCQSHTVRSIFHSYDSGSVCIQLFSALN